MTDELARWKQQQAQDKIRAGDKYTDDGFIVTNEFGHYFEQKTFKDYYDRLLKDAGIGHFTFHALRHTFATRALERGMDYKTLSAILGHYSVAFTMDTYVHSMDEHKRREMDKMDDMFGMQYSISVENQPYPVLCTLSPDGCTAHVPDFPKSLPKQPRWTLPYSRSNSRFKRSYGSTSTRRFPPSRNRLSCRTTAFWYLSKQVDHADRTYIYLSTAQDLPTKTGRLLKNQQPAHSNSYVLAVSKKQCALC
ncbi:tyrosine-type recombinase/integrase [Gemmiger formicilis]|nr:tyrosine-type recombinase/integrase [Gemmiger formicilis]